VTGRSCSDAISARQRVWMCRGIDGAHPLVGHLEQVGHLTLRVLLVGGACAHTADDSARLVLGLVQQPFRHTLTPQRVVGTAALGRVDHLLRQLPGQGVVAREALGQLNRLGDRVVHQLLGDAPIERTLRVEFLVKEDHLLRARRADELSQAGAATSRRDEPKIRLGQPKARPRARDAHIASKRPLETACDRGALDRCNREEAGFGDQVEDTLRHQVERVGGARVGDALEVGA